MDLSDKHELGWLSDLVRDLRSAAAEHDPLLVGALARDLLLHFGSGVAIQRATTDVDLAFAVANWNEFELLRDALLSSGRFTATASAEHTLRHLATLRVDIIPFGGVEDSAGRIEWPGDQGLIRVLGYREARATSLDIRLPGDRRISTASPAMLAVIKVIAWADRHASQPRKDAGDLLLVLRNYLTDQNAQRFYEEGARLLESDDFDYEAAGAWLAGHDAGNTIVSTSSDASRLLSALRDILDVETDVDGELALIGECGVEADRALRLLRSFRDGLLAVEATP